VRAEGELVGPTPVATTASFDEFFLETHERLYRALYFVTGSRHDAEELMQEAFLRLWERWDERDRLRDPTGYLFRVALNGFRMRTRRVRTAARRALGEDREVDPFGEVDLRVDVRAMLLRLTARQRSALVLLDLLGYGSQEAGRILGVRASTVRALAAQGRAALREERADG
jgi:RNA polymerase sigma-70 factor (ECF subfamily)